MELNETEIEIIDYTVLELAGQLNSDISKYLFDVKYEYFKSVLEKIKISKSIDNSDIKNILLLVSIFYFETLDEDYNNFYPDIKKIEVFNLIKKMI